MFSDLLSLLSFQGHSSIGIYNCKDAFGKKEKIKRKILTEAFNASRSGYWVWSESNCNGESTEQLPFSYCTLVTFREVFFVNKVHRKPENLGAKRVTVNGVNSNTVYPCCKRYVLMLRWNNNSADVSGNVKTSAGCRKRILAVDK